MKSNTAIEASMLCQSCGMCCDGTLFSFSKIDPDEIEKVKSLGFNIKKTNKNSLVFAFPCHHLEDSKCTIYDDRPAKCSAYFCRLTKQVIRGDKTFEAALENVKETKEDSIWLKENAPTLNREQRKKLNLSDYLNEYLKTAQNLAEKNQFPNSQIYYAVRVFDYLKKVDLNFREVILLQKYANLLQTIHFKEQRTND